MALVQPDFSEEVQPPKPGSYRAKIVSAEQKIGKTRGTPFINWKLEVQGPSGGFTSYHSTPITGKGAGMFRAMLEALDPSYNGEAVDLDQYIGSTIIVDLAPEIRDGQKTGYLKVSGVSPDTSAPAPESKFTEDDIPF